jgi:hypothetical protein
MSDDEIILRGSSGREVSARMALWVKCLMEMLPPAQLQELVRRVEEHQGKMVVPGVRRHYRMIAEPGQFGLRR